MLLTKMDNYLIQKALETYIKKFDENSLNYHEISHLIDHFKKKTTSFKELGK